MGTSAIPTFNGSSKYAADFQQVLTRAVSIASLPLRQMQKDQDTLSRQLQALQGLQSAFSSMQSTITSVGNAAHGSLTATPSDATVVSASAGDGALDGNYRIEVTG